MLRYIYADDLTKFPKLARSMFKDRARQFADRLGWEVEVQADGSERDEYDNMNPLYVIWERSDGSHGGSMRFLPTTGDTMVNDHFLHLTDGVKIQSPFIWECTRFCLAPRSDPRVSAALMLGGLELGIHFNLSHAVGVFDARMVRIYRRLGWGPTLLGTDGHGSDSISVGLWAFEPEVRPRLLERARTSSEVSTYWFERSFDFHAHDTAVQSA
ncbi:MAG: autoinducer synthase [Boseongicola sp.]|nr:autoinducer synthase [Boseongicola sp.]MDD9978363.1 autoinducer synthase [Boseongicola sp.]